MNGTSPESQTNGRPAGPGFGDGKLKRADELEDVSYVRKKRRRKKKEIPWTNSPSLITPLDCPTEDTSITNKHLNSPRAAIRTKNSSWKP